jgi:hypothetical protein
MANATVRDRVTPPTHARQTTTVTAAILHLDVANGGIAPPGVNHLPCGLIVEGPSAAPIAVSWVDATGTTLVTSITPGIFTRMAPKEITAATVPVLTVFWNPEP